MRRYSLTPRADRRDGEACYAAESLSIEVHSEDQQPAFTGILNADGDRIYRRPDTVPLGFHKRQG